MSGRPPPRRRAVTLLETLIAVGVGALLVIGLTRVLTGSLRSSLLGSNRLTNAQNAAVLLNQLEHDLALALALDVPTEGEGVAQLRLPRPSGPPLPELGRVVLWRPGEDGKGCRRDEDGVAHLFAPGLLVQVRLRRFTVPESGLLACDVAVSVRSWPGGGEEETLRRVVLCRNLVANRERADRGYSW